MRMVTQRIFTHALVAAAIALGASATAAPADCCLTGPQGRADFHVRFREPIALRPTVTGEVASEADAHYTARVIVLIGGYIGSPRLHRVLALSPIRGTSTTAWSPLRLHFNAAQRRRIISAAHKEHRRPVLDVQLTGTLTGHTHPSQHDRQFVMTVA
jgi:hypothetical protein